MEPAPNLDTFEQTLSLQDATMVVIYGKGADAITLRFWIDANHPVIHATIDSSLPVGATATIELWRTERHILPSIEISDVLFDRSKQDNMHGPTIIEPDTLLTDQKNRVGWFHRNIKSVGPRMHAEVQDVTGYHRPDPLLHRTFGAIVTAKGGKCIDNKRLLSPNGKQHCFNIFVDTLHPATKSQWMTRLESHIKKAADLGFDKRRSAHEAWWKERWNRSWILADESTTATDKHADNDQNEARAVTRAYTLQRFINICAGRGAYPIKFNGSIFTVPAKGKPGDADYRRWGPGYWWQNTRLPYVSMCASGDTDLMDPLFVQYIDRFLPLNLYRTQQYFKHGGAYFIECVQFWGDVFNETYGWKPAREREDKLQQSGYHKREWVAGPELIYLALDYYDHTGDDAFLREKILPAADAVLQFFDEHYGTNDDGQLLMHPSMACETWWDTTNPMPELAGLIAITRRLLALPKDLTTEMQHTYWSLFLAKLPPLPTRKIEGKTAFAPAKIFKNKRNIENPELYCVFPFRLASFNRENASLAINALDHRWDKGNSGWRQDEIFMAYLGLIESTRQQLVERSLNYDKNSRFPAFWGPNYDWTPDQTHGGVLMKSFQAMLVQTEPKIGDEHDSKIHLLPVWPRNWNVDFKIHAPNKTIIEGRYHEGVITSLQVTPSRRRIDITLPNGITITP